MSTCSTAGSFPPISAYDKTAVRRMAGAVALSALVHTFFGLSVAPGPPGHARETSAAATISVRLELLAIPQPITPPDGYEGSTLPVPEPPRIERRPAPLPERVRDNTTQSKAPESSGVGPDPTYYAARQLDVYPTLAAALDLRYSPRAAAAGIQGHALVLLRIDANGVVDDVSVVEAEPAGYFEEDARRAFVDARFTPARKDGRAVKSRVLVRVNYGSDNAVQ